MASCLIQEGTPASVTVSTERGINLSILDCIPKKGLIAILQQVSRLSGSKKRKLVTPKKTGVPHGTNATHFFLFVEEMADVLDKYGMNNMFIVMDNAGIHKTKAVVQAIKDRGHHPLFLPPYSPFLNPIEECWPKMKAVVRKTPLKKHESLASRIQEAAKTVTAKDCRGWIRHSQFYFDRCLDMQKDL